MFGPALLAAPVVEPGQDVRSVYLPRGRWIDFWRSVAYRDRDGAFLPRRAVALRGRRAVELAAPVEELPLLIRAGAVIPMLAPDVDTLTNYADSDPELVTLRDRRRELHLLAFPRGSYRSGIGDRGTLRSRETARGWLLQLRGKPHTRYKLRAALSAMRRPLRPCEVSLDGEPLAPRAWDYRRSVLAVRFRASRRSARLRVSGDSACRSSASRTAAQGTSRPSQPR